MLLQSCVEWAEGKWDLLHIPLPLAGPQTKKGDVALCGAHRGCQGKKQSLDRVQRAHATEPADKEESSMG